MTVAQFMFGFRLTPKVGPVTLNIPIPQSGQFISAVLGWRMFAKATGVPAYLSGAYLQQIAFYEIPPDMSGTDFDYRSIMPFDYVAMPEDDYGTNQSDWPGKISLNVAACRQFVPVNPRVIYDLWLAFKFSTAAGTNTLDLFGTIYWDT